MNRLAEFGYRSVADAPAASPPAATAAAPMLITPAGLRRTLWRVTLHGRMAKGGALYQYEAVDYPGLGVTKVTERRPPRVKRTFHVAGDDREFDTVQAAAAAWNHLQRIRSGELPDEGDASQ